MAQLTTAAACGPREENKRESLRSGIATRSHEYEKQNGTHAGATLAIRAAFPFHSPDSPSCLTICRM